MNMKDEGFEKLQQTVNASHHVLPNTATRGKDEIKADIQKLQKAWDDLFTNMNSAKVRRHLCKRTRELSFIILRFACGCKMPCP